MDAVDIVIVSHERADYLVATVDALYKRTPEPFRLTIVDNASGPAVRNWLAENRERFARVLALATNEHVAAFQHGIDATTSDPFVLADPDLLVPDLEPSWLTRLRDLLDRHPDYGLIGMGLVGHTGGGELVEGNVGTWFQMIRRDPLQEPYVKDSLACQAVRDRGYRAGWAPQLLAEHLGHGDPIRYPAHVAEKNAVVSRLVERDELSPYPFYHRELEAIPRPPSLLELAVAAPVVAAIRRAEIPFASVLELSWTEPAVAAVYDEAVAVQTPPPGRVPLQDGAAGPSCSSSHRPTSSTRRSPRPSASRRSWSCSFARSRPWAGGWPTSSRPRAGRGTSSRPWARSDSSSPGRATSSQPSPTMSGS